MKRSITIFALGLAAVLAASAQETRMETFLGYTFVRMNSATNVPSFDANGGSGQFVYNFKPWLGAVADLGAVHTGYIGNAIVDTTISNFLFGPRYAMRKHKHFTPYVQMLWGGAHVSASNLVQGVTPPANGIPGQPVTGRLNASQTAFAFTLGGGVDLKISKHVSFRPIGVDWYLTRFQNLRSQNDNNQNNLRYTTGFNFTYGAR
jgi:opacity protein-like surface antigen